MTWERQRTYDKEEGIEIGREKGRNEKAVEDAENMMKKNYPVDDICEITGLSLEQVLELKEKVSVKI